MVVYLIRVWVIRQHRALEGGGSDLRIKNVSKRANAPLQSIDT